jgi:uncharacterized membrane protein
MIQQTFSMGVNVSVGVNVKKPMQGVAAVWRDLQPSLDLSCDMSFWFGLVACWSVAV